MKKNIIYILIAIGLGSSCSSTRNPGSKAKDQIDVTFVQVNDVYEIAPLEGGLSGGFARVASLKKQYQVKNPNTYLVMAGDFVSPSVYNSLQYEGKRIRGRQMIETMNAAGTDFAIFGNHEFDITESELQSRLNESTFKWIASNTFHKKGNVTLAFEKTSGSGTGPIPETYILNVRDADGTIAKIGFIGITIPFNKAPYVIYTDPLATAVKLYDRIKDSCDVVIAITHQLIKDDILLAQRLPKLAMIIGGHEHDQQYRKEGNVIIAKALANAKSAYIYHLKINTLTHNFKVQTELRTIDATLPFDPVTEAVVKKWSDIAERNYASIGFDAKKIIRTKGEPLDGRESEIRIHPTNLSRIIISGMEAAAPQSDIAIVNSGSIRVDDILQLPISQYDILRSLPFGGSMVEVEMKGTLLIRILEAGRKNIGIGGFLHYSPTLSFNSTQNSWIFKDKPVDPVKNFRVAMTDFLLTGGEANMEFLKKENPEIIKVYPVETALSDPRSDIRLAIIEYMENQK